MSELKTEFKKIIADLEENIENKKDLEYIKTQIYNISMLFINEIDRLADLNMNKMDALIEKHVELNNRISKVEGTINNMEKELFIEDNTDFEIVCPYCNYEFAININTEQKNEVTCPECKNIIELDWNEEDHNCEGHCSCCMEECNYQEEEKEDNDDDM